jgi:hypothetical protein
MYARLSSVSARSSVMSTPVSTISKTTPVSDTAGPRKTETLPRSGWTSSLSAKIVFIAVVFVLVPVFLYLEFRRAYQESQELLLSSVRAEGRAISQSLLPLLETIDNAALPDLGRHLAPFASEVTTIKLLLRSAGTSARSDAFYYLASWPAVTQSNLQAEHDTLAQQGVLERLGENCSGEMPFSLIYHRPTGGAEIVAVSSRPCPGDGPASLGPGINAVRWVGHPLPRYEDPVLLRGRGRYTADLAKGARILRFLRSPVARGRILAVNAPPEVPIITAALLGDVKPICPRLDRPDYVPVAQPILAHERVTYVGEPIAAVIGDTAAEAEDLPVIDNFGVPNSQDLLFVAERPLRREVADGVEHRMTGVAPNPSFVGHTFRFGSNYSLTRGTPIVLSE